MTNPLPASPPLPRVLHVTSALDPGGIETWLSRLIQIPEGEGLVGGVLVLSFREGLLAPLFRGHGIPVYCLPVAPNPLRFIQSVRRVLAETGPWEIVHSHVHRRSALVLCAAWLAGVPVRISHSHNTRGQDAVALAPLRSLLKSLATHALNCLSNVRLACSQDAARALYGKNASSPTATLAPAGAVLRRGRSAPVFCMPYGMDLDEFHRRANVPVSRESLGIPPGARVVGHVGRFMPQKNHRFLLEVAAEAIRRDPQLHFLLVGDGPLRPEMEALATRLQIRSQITFTGNRLDVPALMRQCMDCFFLPSQWEGLGIVLLEAQATGLPCVFTDVVPQEANLVPERNYLFPRSASPEAVAGLLLNALNERPAHLGRIPDPLHRLYSLSGNAWALARLYRESLSATGGNPESLNPHAAWSNQ